MFARRRGARALRAGLGVRVSAGPDAIKSLQATVRRLQGQLEEMRQDGRLERFRKLQKDLEVGGLRRFQGIARWVFGCRAIEPDWRCGRQDAARCHLQTLHCKQWRQVSGRLRGLIQEGSRGNERSARALSCPHGRKRTRCAPASGSTSSPSAKCQRTRWARAVLDHNYSRVPPWFCRIVLSWECCAVNAGAALRTSSCRFGSKRILAVAPLRRPAE